jgi:hypothetical protein
MLSLLQARPALILGILQYEHRLQGQVEQFKAIVEPKDGSRLHINEVWLSGALHKYAYYWLTPTGALVQGWDNAPHHPQIATSPHHTHTPTGIAPSHVRSLLDVLAEIEKQI